MTMMIWIRPPQYEGNGERQRQDDERMSEIIVIDDRYDDGTTRSNSMRGNET